MADCTDCIQQTPDPCKGIKKPTKCILSLDAIPSLGVAENEQLDITLQKIGNLLQTVFTSIEGYDPEAIQTLQNDEGTLKWVSI